MCQVLVGRIRSADRLSQCYLLRTSAGTSARREFRNTAYPADAYGDERLIPACSAPKLALSFPRPRPARQRVAPSKATGERRQALRWPLR
jgi:hypothetical protein